MRMPVRGAQAVVALPLSTGARTIGAIGLLFSEPRTLEPAELEFLDILADTCAQGLERISAQQAAATQSAKLAFLADAATELASSLDYEVTLANVARLAVPTFADWCAIDVVDDGRLRRVAVAHVDPAKVQLAHDLAERYPTDPDAPRGAWQVMRTGRSELIAEVTDAMLVAGAVDADHLHIARALHLRSVVTVPLVARGRVLGVITWVAAESERHYSSEDLALAEELAKRAAVSLDNAELHSQTLAAAVELQHAVLPAMLPNMPGWEIGHHYSPSGRTEVGGDFYDVLELDGSRLAMFVGDVMGRGVAAAAAMAQMRAAVRAYAALDPTPEVVLSRLDQMYDHYQTQQLVTLLYLLADPTRDELVVGNAGHPPPLLLRGDGSLTTLPFADGAPLGVISEGRHHSTVEFHAGDTVVAFTDGLIERRDEDITDGQARLARAVSGLTGQDLATALAQTVANVRDPSRDDDVAVLAVRRHR
jgi:serine phosphatase RsbU (regulator of sigma subunit)